MAGGLARFARSDNAVAASAVPEESKQVEQLRINDNAEFGGFGDFDIDMTANDDFGFMDSTCGAGFDFMEEKNNFEAGCIGGLMVAETESNILVAKTDHQPVTPGMPGISMFKKRPSGNLKTPPNGGSSVIAGISTVTPFTKKETDAVSVYAAQSDTRKVSKSGCASSQNSTIVPSAKSDGPQQFTKASAASTTIRGMKQTTHAVSGLSPSPHALAVGQTTAKQSRSVDATQPMGPPAPRPVQTVTPATKLSDSSAKAVTGVSPSPLLQPEQNSQDVGAKKSDLTTTGSDVPDSFEDMHSQFVDTLRDFEDEKLQYKKKLLDLTVKLDGAIAELLRTQANSLDLIEEMESIDISVSQAIRRTTAKD